MAVERIGVSLEGPLLADFDRYIAKEGFGSRSEGLRNLIVEGDARRVATLANRLKTVKGVLSAETVVASPKVR
jgi:metal-responsive CopG/Arc/MetJ family transcriptional regulator